jgi:gluconolactonase
MNREDLTMTLRRIPLLFVAFFVALGNGAADEKKDPPIKFKLERLDVRLDKLIPKDAKLETLADGFAWTEGPVWMPAGYLLFSDIPNNRIVKWQEGKGTSDFLKPSGYSGKRTDFREPGTNGLTIDSEGRLVMCEHGDRRISRLEKDGKTKTTLVDKFEGKRLNSPNDLAYRSNGDLYFTDPPYGRMLKKFTGLSERDLFPDRDLDFCGVYRLAKDGKLTLLTKQMSKPNGIAFSPDERTLYVANSDPFNPVWMAFPVKEDGTLGSGKVFFDARKLFGKKPGIPDGMKVDHHGNLFATGPGGVQILDPDGTHLGTVETGVPTANCAWGSEDGSVLYICANTAICRIKTTTKGPKK